MDIITLVELEQKCKRLLKTAKFLHGDKWPEIKQKYAEVVKGHHQKEGTQSLLASAINIANKETDGMVQITFLACVLDD